ncbi:MAG: SBBP repeat-containing protein [Blastocatellia bacterium]|nr:SBBP repeat-containing protein [Blastocatellia bacterium]
MNKTASSHQRRVPPKVWFYVQCVAALMMVISCEVAMTSKRDAQPQAVQEGAGKTEPIESRSPIYFELNQGQTDAAVRSVARGNGYGLYLTADEAVFALRPAESEGRRSRLSEGLRADRMVRSEDAAPGVRLAMKLVDAERPVAITGEEPRSSRSNYLIGKDPAGWHRGVPHYAKVRYERVYPGIDLVYYGNQRELEYDFIVAPGADPKRIGVAFEGASALGVAADGGLLLQTAAGEIRQHKPVVYQEIAGERREVAGRYVVRGEREIGFEVGAYDASQALVIDPVLIYSTYIGGSDQEIANGVEVDAAGNTYVAGITYSLDFPVKNALQFSLRGAANAWVAKFDSAGRLIYNTYLGGNNEDAALTVTADGAGNVYLAGGTNSTDFPMTSSSAQPQSRGQLDGFISKLNADGSALVYSTFMGGSADDLVLGVALDNAANLYITGQTLSNNFPNRDGLQASLRGASDAFVTKLSADGTTWQYSTFIGGNGKEVGFGVTVDGQGAAYVTGFVLSTDFPTRNPVQSTFGGRVDAFVSKVNAAGNALVYSTFFGGSEDDGGYGIGVDATGSVTVTGLTNSPNLLMKNAAQAALGGGDDAFVARFDAAGGLVFSSYLGGQSDDQTFDLAITSAGNAYVVGKTESANFPVKDPVQAKIGVPEATQAAPAQESASRRLVRSNDGEIRLPIDKEYGREWLRRGVPVSTAKSQSTKAIVDGFIAKIGPDGQVGYASYLGGNDEDKAFSIAVDTQGNAYVAGQTASANFPVKTPAQRFLRGVLDGFVTKIADNATTQASVSAASYQLSAGLAPESIVAAFGPELASATQASSTLPLPMTLGGVRVFVRSGSGPDQPAPLFFVSPTQINYLMPAGLTEGDIRVIVEANGVVISSEAARIDRVAPGLFSANASGQGVAAGVILRVRGDGSQVYEPLSRFDSTVNRFVPIPIDLSNGQVYLLLFGTGFRGRDSLTSVAASIGGTSAQVLYAGPQADFAGLDQINLLLPASLAGRGDVTLDLSVGGKAANKVIANFK